MAAGDLGELRVVIQHQDWVRTIGLGFQALTDDEDWMHQLGEQWLEIVAPAWCIHMNFVAHIRRVELFRVTGEGPEFVRISPNPRPEGIDEGQVAPHQCAALIRWTTGLAGRSNRGRSYLWCFSVYHVLNGQEMGEGIQERMQALIDVMLALYGPTGTSAVARFVIISRQLDLEQRLVPVAIPVTGAVPVPTIATQRNRVAPRPGGG